jgi:hypothetical protein
MVRAILVVDLKLMIIFMVLGEKHEGTDIDHTFVRANRFCRFPCAL